MLKLLLGPLVILGLVSGCGPSDSPAPGFDEVRAFQYLEDQVKFGPRVPGTEEAGMCRQYFYQHFESLGFSVDSQTAYFIDTYTGVDTPLVNIIVHIEGDDQGLPILLAAHYDSRPRADLAFDSTYLDSAIDGANDGASGVAILMELAVLCAEKKPPVDIDLLLLDAEDWGKSGDRDQYLLGSKEFARAGIREKYRFGIVIDMIGDASQQIYREQFSETYHPDLNNMIWQAATALGVTTFVDSVKYTMLDDHIPLSAGGVPTVVVIDFDYPYWHTEMDGVAQCSPVSLANVGRVITMIVYSPSLWPKMK
jgi:glutaminyl-peptide cyclotransferase